MKLPRHLKLVADSINRSHGRWAPLLWQLGMVVMLAGALRASAFAQAAHGAVEPVDCSAEFELSLSEPDTVECSYVTVPLTRDQASEDLGRTLRLAVVTLRSRSETPRPDPLFMAQGGPGGSTIDSFIGLMEAHPLRDERDIVLFDQRGAYFSQPNLICTELFDALPQVLPLPYEETQPITAAALAACRQRLAAEDIDLAAFNSVENAADVEDLRVALGYDAINFYGVSYGTLLGLHLMRDHPEHVRSVILDGVVAPQTDFILHIAENTERVFSELFAACSADPRCTEQYPALEERFLALADQLDREPIFLAISDPDTGEQMQVRLGGDDLVDFAFQLFYLNGGAALLPRVVAEMEKGDASFVRTLLPLLLFDRTWSDGMYQSVICTEEVDSPDLVARLDGVRPRFAHNAQRDLQGYVDACELWQVPHLPAFVDEPVHSDIPTLLLSGQFDPITPPEFAEAAADTLSQGFLVTDPTGGHGVALNANPCIDTIVADFLDRPAALPEAGCLAEDASPDFVPADAIKVAVLGELNRLQPAAVAQLGMAGLCLLGISSALVVWPAGMLARKLRDQRLMFTPEQRRLRRLSRMLVLAFVGLTLIFAAGLVTATIYVALDNGLFLLISALPRWTAPLFFIPPVLASVAAAMVFAAGMIWRSRHGGLGSRLYYTFLTVCAVGYVLTVAAGGMMFVIF